MRWLALVIVLALGACASPDGSPNPEQLRGYWESQNVYPSGYKADLLAFLRSYLNDLSNIRNAGVSQPQRKTVGFGERYVVCVRYDAKKSSGEYAGVKDSMAVFVSGKLDRLIETTGENRDLCKDAAYAPFPELARLAR
jgi:hypothetical protein